MAKKKSCKMEVSLEWNDIYFKMCIKIGEFVLGQLMAKHTRKWLYIKARFPYTQVKGANGK